MALLHDNVFDAALNIIGTSVDKIQVVKASSGVLVSKVSSASDITFTGPANGSTGRKITFDGISSISASASGSATKVRLLKSSGSVVLVVASITGSPVSIASTDKVNIGSFKVELADP
jgi:hypothetical protein